MGHSEQMWQQGDLESRERKSYEVAARLHMAMLDGYLTPDEFEHVLNEMGIPTDRKLQERERAKE